MKNQSMSDQIMKDISKDILNGKLNKGDKIPIESELMDRYEVSRTSVREAIKMLTAIGVLVIKRGDGTYVSDRVNTSMINPLIFSLLIEPKDSYQLYELRLIFESGALKLATLNANEDDIKRAEDNIEILRGIDCENNIEDAINLDIEFHKLMLQATHNDLVKKIGETIFNLYPRYVKKSLIQKNGLNRTVERHTRLLEAVKNRQTTNLYELVEGTLDEWKNEWK